MEINEWSNEFDILYNNITSNQAPGLDNYEKSVFLTKAQEEVIQKFFNAKENKVMEGFDHSEKRQMDFSNLIKEIDDIPVTDNKVNLQDVLSDETPFLILNEYAKVNGEDKVIVPLHYKEYQRLLNKPYHFPLKNQVWKLDLGLGEFKLIPSPSDTITLYSIRYLKNPNPIILENLENGLTINGQSEERNCELVPSIHREILQRAVELAKAAYVADLNTQVALGMSSQTGIGIISRQ